LEGFESTRTVLIISDYYEDIKNDIFRELNRGVTYLNGVGTYSEQEKVVLMVVLSRNEIGPLKKIIDNRDKEAFMVILPNTEAIGYGFKRMS